jgi:hypothetical protein
MIDLVELQKLMDEYISSLDNTRMDEMCTTDKGFAMGELPRFMAWLEKRASSNTFSEHGSKQG